MTQTYFKRIWLVLIIFGVLLCLEMNARTDLDSKIEKMHWELNVWAEKYHKEIQKFEIKQENIHDNLSKSISKKVSF